MISEFSHAHSTILAQCGMLAVFVKTMQVEEMQNYKNISIFCRGKPKSGEKKQDLKKSLIDCVSEK